MKMDSLKVVAWCLMLSVVTSIVSQAVGQQQQQQVENVYWGSRATRSSANAIVFVFLERLDGDEDGRVSLTDVRSEADNYFRRFPSVSYMHEVKGYLLAAAKVADSNGDGYLDRNEIKRAATALVEEAGSVQVGRIVELSEALRRRIGGAVPTYDFDYIIDGLDRNKDDVISSADIDRLVAFRRFRFFRRNFETAFESADGNDDGDLDREEARQWMTAVNSTSVFGTLNLFIYSKTALLAGSEVADEWAQVHA